MAALRIVFMGSGELSCASLKALAHHSPFGLVAVVTQPDRPGGRDLKPQPTPVKGLATQLGLPILQPPRAREATFLDQLRQLGPDLVIVAAYGQLLPPAILDVPPRGCLNVHASLLPKYRGAAPIQWAIANGEIQTGVTLMRMDAGLDTGDIVAQHPAPIHPDDTAATLQDRLAHLGAELLLQTVPDYVAGKLRPRPQPAEGVSHAPKIKKTDGRLDWNRPAEELLNRLRAFTPWPGGFTFLQAQPRPHLLKVWKAQRVEKSGPPGTILAADKSGIVVGCGRQALRIVLLQREGGRRLTAAEFLAGHRLAVGDRLV